MRLWLVLGAANAFLAVAAGAFGAHGLRRRVAADLLVVFDHLRHELTIMACAFVEEDGGVDAAYERAAGRIAEARSRLRGATPVPAQPAVADPPRFTSNMEREEFEAAVTRIVEYVHAGDAFQVVPSQRFSAPAPVSLTSSAAASGLSRASPQPAVEDDQAGDEERAARQRRGDVAQRPGEEEEAEPGGEDEERAHQALEADVPALARMLLPRAGGLILRELDAVVVGLRVPAGLVVAPAAGAGSG